MSMCINQRLLILNVSVVMNENEKKEIKLFTSIHVRIKCNGNGEQNNGDLLLEAKRERERKCQYNEHGESCFFFFESHISKTLIFETKNLN
jgi:hypothetical protein